MFKLTSLLRNFSKSKKIRIPQSTKQQQELQAIQYADLLGLKYKPVNDQIKLTGNVNLIDSNGTLLKKEIDISRAREIAEQQNYDLVQITASPPTVRLTIFKTEIQDAIRQKSSEEKLELQANVTRRLKIGINITENDLKNKLSKIQDFMSKHNKISIEIFAKRRQMETEDVPLKVEYLQNLILKSPLIAPLLDQYKYEYSITNLENGIIINFSCKIDIIQKEAKSEFEQEKQLKQQNEQQMVNETKTELSQETQTKQNFQKQKTERTKEEDDIDLLEQEFSQEIPNKQMGDERNKKQDYFGNSKIFQKLMKVKEQQKTNLEQVDMVIENFPEEFKHKIQQDKAIKDKFGSKVLYDIKKGKVKLS